MLLCQLAQQGLPQLSSGLLKNDSLTETRKMENRPRGDRFGVKCSPHQFLPKINGSLRLKKKQATYSRDKKALLITGFFGAHLAVPRFFHVWNPGVTGACWALVAFGWFCKVVFVKANGLTGATCRGLVQIKKLKIDSLPGDSSRDLFIPYLEVT